MIGISKIKSCFELLKIYTVYMVNHWFIASIFPNTEEKKNYYENLLLESNVMLSE